MKKIGQGWQYTAYDLGNGRVLKKFNNPFVSLFLIIVDLFSFGDFRFWLIPKYLREIRLNAHMSLKMIELLNVDPSWFGNIKWLSKLDFEQDKVTPLSVYFEDADQKEAREIIDKFIDFNKKLLEYHIGDKIFNIAQNFGFDSEGNVVLMDVGELYAGEKLVKQMGQKIWHEKYITTYIPKHSRKYFTKRMDKLAREYFE